MTIKIIFCDPLLNKYNKVNTDAIKRALFLLFFPCRSIAHNLFFLVSSVLQFVGVTTQNIIKTGNFQKEEKIGILPVF